MRTLRILSTISAAFFALLTTSAGATEQTTILAGGCFWCVESDFESLDGIISAESGFIGGTTQNPTYKSHGDHIEAVKIVFDSDIISYETVLHNFFRSVDPTDAGGQFCDRGINYTTAIFTFDETQTALAEIAKDAAMTDLGREIVTPIRAAKTFYPVGDYHQDYYKSNKYVLTRFGYITKADAYKRYRKGCGRDASVKRLWGDAAPFVN